MYLLSILRQFHSRQSFCPDLYLVFAQRDILFIKLYYLSNTGSKVFLYSEVFHCYCPMLVFVTNVLKNCVSLVPQIWSQGLCIVLWSAMDSYFYLLRFSVFSVNEIKDSSLKDWLSKPSWVSICLEKDCGWFEIHIFP